jgi:predicted N-formylglutamate amidohydrolase
MIDMLAADGDLIIGDNEPYGGGLPGDTIDRHATRAGLANALIEVRQDLIAGPEAAQAWGERLSRVMQAVLSKGLQQAAA